MFEWFTIDRAPDHIDDQLVPAWTWASALPGSQTNTAWSVHVLGDGEAASFSLLRHCVTTAPPIKSQSAHRQYFLSATSSNAKPGSKNVKYTLDELLVANIALENSPSRQQLPSYPSLEIFAALLFYTPYLSITSLPLRSLSDGRLSYRPLPAIDRIWGSPPGNVLTEQPPNAASVTDPVRTAVSNARKIHGHISPQESRPKSDLIPISAECFDVSGDDEGQAKRESPIQDLTGHHEEGAGQPMQDEVKGASESRRVFGVFQGGIFKADRNEDVVCQPQALNIAKLHAIEVFDVSDQNVIESKTSNAGLDLDTKYPVRNIASTHLALRKSVLDGGSIRRPDEVGRKGTNSALLYEMACQSQERRLEKIIRELEDELGWLRAQIKEGTVRSWNLDKN